MKHSYPDDVLIEAVRSSISYAQVLKKLKIVPAGGNYYTLKSKISNLNLDITHFVGQAWNRGKKNTSQQRPLEDYLTNKYSIKSHSLRLRLIRDGIFKSKCSSCKLNIWLEKPIPLELDHIDGNHFNNLLKNLRLLCPNCHAQTPTYRSKNRR